MKTEGNKIFKTQTLLYNYAAKIVPQSETLCTTCAIAAYQLCREGQIELIKPS